MAAYINGYSNSMDVLGFGFTTQSAMFYQSQHATYDVHQGVTCDGCGANPLRGIRWRCQSCPDHDICNSCKKQGLFSGHSFEIMSTTSTNNANAMASGGQITSEAGVHWTSCQGCGMYPIKGTLYTCTVCPKYDVCQNCNTQRIQNPEAHPHRFDFNYMPQACNPPPTQAGGPGRDSAHNPSQQHYHQPQQYQQQQQQSYAEYDNTQNGAQGYAAPPPPHYEGERPTKLDSIFAWLGGHLVHD